jgi:hypothetical protein
LELLRALASGALPSVAACITAVAVRNVVIAAAA